MRSVRHIHQLPSAIEYTYFYYTYSILWIIKGYSKWI